MIFVKRDLIEKIEHRTLKYHNLFVYKAINGLIFLMRRDHHML